MNEAEISAIETALYLAKQGVHPSDVVAALRDPNGRRRNIEPAPVTWGRLVDILTIYADVAEAA